MANPLVPQGFLNRVRGAVSVTDVPALNITASYLGKDAISMRPDGPATDIIPTLTGIRALFVLGIEVLLRQPGTNHSTQDQAVTDAIAQRLQCAALQAVDTVLLVVQRVNSGI